MDALLETLGVNRAKKQAVAAALVNLIEAIVDERTRDAED